MPLFGSGKPKYEELAQYMEGEIESLFRHNESERKNLPILLGTVEGQTALFSQYYPALRLMGMGIVNAIREAKNSDEATFQIERYGDLMEHTRTITYVEALSKLILGSRLLAFDLFDAHSKHNDEKVAELRKEIETAKFTPEQKEALDSILKGFKDAQSGIGSKK